MRSTASFCRPICLALLVASAFAFAACTSALDLQDGAPRVTWVAVVPSDAPQTTPAEITVWVADLEGDSVDLIAQWVDDAGVARSLVQSVGTYGLVGLTTRDALFSADGEPHRILWDVSGVPAGAQVRLRFSPDDRPFDDEAGEGAEVESPAFDISVGLPEAVELIPIAR